MLYSKAVSVLLIACVGWISGEFIQMALSLTHSCIKYDGRD